MKKYFVIFAIGAASLASCSKESSFEPQAGKTVISVGIAETKTTIGEAVDGKRPVYWANGDKLVANGVTSAALADVPENAKTANFEFEGILAAPVNLLYPASLYVDASTVNIAPSQGLVAVAPMYGHAESLDDAAMHHLMSLLSISLVKGDEADRITAVTLSSATQPLSGDFTIDYGTGALSSSADPAAAVKTVNVNRTLSSEPVSILVPVPAGTYDLQVKIKDEMGHVMTKTITGRTFTAGAYVNLPTVTFAPTSTEIDVEIASADEWNAFATLANENIPSYKDKVVSIIADLDFTGKDIVTLGAYDGGDGYFEGSVLGNGHSIRNLVSSNYLIGTIGGAGMVRDLTFDSSCAFSVVFEAGTQKHFGPLTEYVKGTVRNCHNNAPVTLAGIEGVTPDKDIFIGGLVGRIREGQVIDCSNSGKISFVDSYVSTSYIYAGGICGYSSNNDGLISGCTNTGVIETSALAAQVYAGGIVGQHTGTVDGCTNEAMLTSAIARPSGDACKQIGFGGIAGKAKDGSSMTGCVNSGNVVFSTGVKILYAGGLAAIVDGTMDRLENNTSAGSIVSSKAARQFIFGGLFGRVQSPNVFTFEGTPFTGAISISGYEDNSNVYFFVGGLVGHVKEQVTIQAPEGKTCSVADNIIITGEAKNMARMCVGGVVGSAGEDGTNVADGVVPHSIGKAVTLRNIVSSGSVKIDGNAILVSSRYSAFGGIIGGAYGGAVIDGCSSTADVYFGSGTMSQKNSYFVVIGGIAGDIAGGNSTMTNCTTNSKVYSYSYNNNTWTAFNGNMNGGLIGAFGYRGDNAFELVMRNCSSSSTLYSYRGAAGGLAGFADRATFENCTFSGSVSRGAPAAGIAAVATNTAVNGCTVKATQLKAVKAGSTVANVGGVIGTAAASSVDGTKVFTTMTSDGLSSGAVAGGIMGAPDAACTIGSTSACAFGGSVAGTAVDASNVATLAIGNTAMTPAAVSYWDGQ